MSCASNRHRSVGFGFTTFHVLKSRGYSVELIHWNSSHWSEMACGGRTACCQNVRASLEVIRNLLTLPPISSTSASSAPSARASMPSNCPSTRTSKPSQSTDLTGDSVGTGMLAGAAQMSETQRSRGVAWKGSWIGSGLCLRTGGERRTGE